MASSEAIERLIPFGFTFRHCAQYVQIAEHDSSHFHGDFGDHIHESSFEKTGDISKRVPTCGFDYNAVEQAVSGEEPADDPKDLSWAEASGLFTRLLDWCLLARSLTESGARIAAARLWISGPDSCGFTSYTDIAKEAGLTKAAVSKWIVSLRDSLGGHLPPSSSKRDFARDNYRKAQKAAVAAGVHSSFKTKGKSKQDDTPTKRCKTCGKQMPVTSFYHCKHSADGYGDECKAHVRARRADYFAQKRAQKRASTPKSIKKSASQVARNQ